MIAKRRLAVVDKVLALPQNLITKSCKTGLSIRFENSVVPQPDMVTQVNMDKKPVATRVVMSLPFDEYSKWTASFT
jgi:hypothetical protein